MLGGGAAAELEVLLGHRVVGLPVVILQGLSMLLLPLALARKRCARQAVADAGVLVHAEQAQPEGAAQRVPAVQPQTCQKCRGGGGGGTYGGHLGFILQPPSFRVLFVFGFLVAK